MQAIRCQCLLRRSQSHKTSYLWYNSSAQKNIRESSFTMGYQYTMETIPFQYYGCHVSHMIDNSDSKKSDYGPVPLDCHT